MTDTARLIVELLEGRAKGAREKDARRALAQELRSLKPLDLGLRCFLADLIDPDRNEINLQIRFVRRRKGKPSNPATDKRIAQFIAGIAKDDGVESAVTQAKQEFGLSRSRLMAIWGEWRPILKRLERPR
jgi:hypothetical protein